MDRAFDGVAVVVDHHDDGDSPSREKMPSSWMVSCAAPSPMSNTVLRSGCAIAAPTAAGSV